MIFSSREWVQKVVRNQEILHHHFALKAINNQTVNAQKTVVEKLGGKWQYV